MGSVFQMGDSGRDQCGPHQLSEVINIVSKAVALVVATVVQYIGHTQGAPGAVLKMRILAGDKTWFWQCQ